MSICTPYRPLARAKRDGRMSGGGVQTEYSAFGLSWMRSRYLWIVGQYARRYLACSSSASFFVQS